MSTSLTLWVIESKAIDKEVWGVHLVEIHLGHFIQDVPLAFHTKAEGWHYLKALRAANKMTHTFRMVQYHRSGKHRMVYADYGR